MPRQSSVNVCSQVKLDKLFETIHFMKLVHIISFIGGLSDCVHTMPAHFENDEKCDGSKI